jgi:hypothetical protein
MTENDTGQSEVLGAQAARPLGVLEGIRAFGVVLGGSVVLALLAAGAFASAVRALASFRLPSARALAGCAVVALYATVLRPWHLRWGATAQEETKPLPGDEFLPRDGTQILHAVTIDAPVDEVWPWIAQLGQDRGGFYSYEWLENLAGCEMRNADRIHPEWQHRDVGDVLFLHPAGGMEVTMFEPGRALGMRNWGNIVLEPIGPDRTRLLIRGRIAGGPFALAYAALMEVPHFIMERRMLLGIKDLAERSAGARGAGAG